MHSATQTLRKEHEVILRMIDATEQTARQLEQGELVPAEVLENLQEFFQLFADRCHHGKEEDLLFPLLEQKGMPRIGGPVGVMLMEHEEGRRLIRAMGNAAQAYAAGDTAAGREPWAEAARAYATLLRQHIMKENEVLFVMAERLLSEDEQRQLSEAFEQLEDKKMGVGTHERLHAKMEKLLAEMAPVKAAR
jgi:hemerythrin-like domain-containing protein